MSLRNPPAFVQSGGQSADTVRRMMGSLLSAPGIVAAGDLLVAQHAGVPAMSVDIALGGAWVLGTAQSDQGYYHAWNDGVVTLVVAASNPTNPRRDLVVLSVQDAAYSGAANQAVLQVVTGTAAPSPVDPVVPANTLLLARLTIPANKTSILNADITDLRTVMLPATPQAGTIRRLTSAVWSTTIVTGAGEAGLAPPMPFAIVTVAGTRRLRITVSLPWLSVGTVASTQGAVKLYENGVVVGTGGFAAAAGYWANCSFAVERTVAAGTYAYQLTVSFSATGTGNNVYASAAAPISCLVDDVT